MRVVRWAGPITVRTGVQPRTERTSLELEGGLVAMTFRKAGFIDWREAAAEFKEFNGE